MVAQALEDFRIDKGCRTEHATVNVNVRDVASTNARVHYPNRVCGNAIWAWDYENLKISMLYMP